MSQIVGQSNTASASATLSDGITRTSLPAAYTVVWSSDNSNVASVQQSQTNSLVAVINANAPGTANITCAVTNPISAGGSTVASSAIETVNLPPPPAVVSVQIVVP